MLFLASTGSVLSSQKITGTQGNFAGALHDLDEFGGSLASLGDLDGTGAGVRSLAVGAAGDDDGGANRGALYLLNLSGTATVASYQKISSTQGNFSSALLNADGFGTACAALGYLAGPGPSGAALVVGAGTDDDGGIDRGAVYVLFLGGSPPLGVPGASGKSPGGLLGGAKPNPFHSRTAVSFRLNAAAEVQIEIRDVGGRLVRRLVRRHAGPGEEQVEWDGKDDSGRALAAGTYFLGLVMDGRALSSGRKAVLLK